jgi:hypothetical protein
MTSQPLLLITDSNIWIDLDHGGLIDEIFRLPYQISTPDLSRPEIKSVDIHLLIQKGLVFQSLDRKLITELAVFSQTNRQLAIADLAAFL